MTELDRCWPWIEAAIRHGGGEFTFDDVKDAITAGRMQLWPAQDACAVTQISGTRRRKLVILFAGGNLETLTDMFESFAAFARANKCDALFVSGRKGWTRALKGLGFKEKYTVLERGLT